MGDMLSQAEIDALLSGNSLNMESNTDHSDTSLSAQEIDALGEIGNISMGTSATTLFTLLGHKVLITTPKVTITSWKELSEQYISPYVAVKVEYTHGLVGSNLLIMKENDVKMITDLMMGGDGKGIDQDQELSDLHLSAISEAMNQMVGSSATSMSSMFDKKIDISPPKPFIIHFDNPQPFEGFEQSGKVVKVAFKMVVGELIDSEIMQLLPLDFAKALVGNLLSASLPDSTGVSPEPQYSPIPRSSESEAPVHSQNPGNTFQKPDVGYDVSNNNYQSSASPVYQQGYSNMNNAPQEPIYTEQPAHRAPVNVQPAQFQALNESKSYEEKKNIGLLMDVPLQVTVELGRTHKAIREILEFGPGSIIELDKLAGEPVDILINGKAVAKGEVVVIDESFGVRVTDIIHPSKRL